MPISIKGKRIVLTGGARGIGADSVRYLAGEGADIVSFDVLDDLGAAVAADASAKGAGKVFFEHVDVSDLAEVEAGMKRAVEQLGGLDAVLNIAGIDLSSPAESISAAHWDRMLAVNMKGVAFPCQAAFPYLRDNGGGSIVNFGSDAGLMAFPPGGAHYSAAKSGVFGYTRTIAGEWGQYGIRANSLNPAIKTPMYEEHIASLTEEELALENLYYKQNIPLGGQLGDATADLAPVLAFLVSDASRFITSQIIGVNGGLLPTR
ncbi:MAG: SDR family NAD(P)-dependent oxidoreductase [Sphingobium sp.]